MRLIALALSLSLLVLSACSGAKDADLKEATVTAPTPPPTRCTPQDGVSLTNFNGPHGEFMMKDMATPSAGGTMTVLVCDGETVRPLTITVSSETVKVVGVMQNRRASNGKDTSTPVNVLADLDGTPVTEAGLVAAWKGGGDLDLQVECAIFWLGACDVAPTAAPEEDPA